ncbi:MAG: ribosome maturation factor RimM [Pseudomonadota bacterium]
MVKQPNTLKDLVVVGALMGAHGVRGDVKVKSFTAEPADVFTYGPLLDEAGAIVLDATNIRPAKAHFIATPKSPRTREDWETLKGTRLHVPLEALPDTDDDEIYVDELLGLSASDSEGAALGKVKAVQNYGAGDLLEIAPAGGGASVFIPFTEEDVPDIDLAGRRITITSWALWTETDDEKDA